MLCQGEVSRSGFDLDEGNKRREEKILALISLDVPRDDRLVCLPLVSSLH
jgi:hypothetical protein